MFAIVICMLDQSHTKLTRALENVSRNVLENASKVSLKRGTPSERTHLQSLEKCSFLPFSILSLSDVVLWNDVMSLTIS